MVMDLATRSDVMGVVLHLVHENISRIGRVINEVIDTRICCPVLGRGGFINDLANGSLHICGQPVSEIFIDKDSLLKLQKSMFPATQRNPCRWSICLEFDSTTPKWFEISPKIPTSPESVQRSFLKKESNTK